MKFLPADPLIVIATSVSSAFVPVNTSSGSKTFFISCTFHTYMRRGTADVTECTASDFRVPANTPLYFDFAPGEGVRVLRASGADSTIQIGDISK